MKFNLIAPMMAASALALALSTPAMAESKGDRAQKAIAAANAKIEAAMTSNADAELPGRLARAKEDLANAKEAVSAGRKDEAIELANHANAEADTAIAVTVHRKDERTAAAVETANTVAANASEQTADAHAQAADANARAASAETAAQMSAQQAQAAQTAAANAQMAAATAVPAPAPAEVSTSVTTHSATGSTTHRTTVKRKAVRHPSATTGTTTTTTVDQHM